MQGISNEPPPFTQNQFGANAGGPLTIPKLYDGRDKTFWFFSWEGFRLREGQTFTTTVPTAAERAGNFSAITTPVMDPCGGTVATAVGCPGYAGPATQFAGNVLPTSRLNPTSLALLQYFPMPNSAGTAGPDGTIVNNYTTASSGGGNQNQVVGRLDQNIGANQHIFFRYTYWNVLDLPVDPLGTGICDDRCAETYSSHAAALGYNCLLYTSRCV